MKAEPPNLSGGKDIDRRISNHVRLQLRIADIRQVEVQRALGHSRSTSRRRLHGERPITGSDLVQIARLTGLTVTELFPADLRA
ncbi:hypothetical protein GS575_09300 [Rhodococcus hoagii]|nr:hypothetical protein [Prescottella equi]